MTKFVVRLLDASDVLLAWAEVQASPRPQGRPHSCPFWPNAPTQFVITQAGIAAKITIHWCDLDLARNGTPIDPTPVQVGQVFNWAWIEPIWLVPATEQDVPLPPVTLQNSVTLAVPVGALTGAGR